jgi:hypothetical protein
MLNSESLGSRSSPVSVWARNRVVRQFFQPPSALNAGSPEATVPAGVTLK